MSFEDDFDQLYRNCYRRLLAKAVVVTGGEPVPAQDAVQEAFVRCWERMSTQNGPPVLNWDSWLSVIVVREALKGRADSARSVGLEGHDPPSSNLDLASALQIKDAYRRVCKGVAGLSARRRSVVALRFIAGLNTAQVADELCISESAVRAHIALARKDLHPQWLELKQLGIVDDDERREA
ncbi:RNA polymerase sigma factor [Streptomyces iakyrus]|uniref:RNA polymerase sigma factor n=1 Tax=Streptomyces iakyrus TaxID=68219 RepID=UPI0036EC9FCE